VSLLGPATALDVRTAYRHCEQVTRQQAKNFSYGISLLPGDKRRALSAVYAFARRIDDVGDGTMPDEEKLSSLESIRGDLTALTEAVAGSDDSALPAGGAPPAPPAPSAFSKVDHDPVLFALRDAATRFPIPLAAFGELIDGCEADVRGVKYVTLDDLRYYCRCVAGSVGRLSLGVFGSTQPARASELADTLGLAMQLVNIIRDIREDLGNGRVYLPAEDLDRFGCTLEPGAGPDGKGVMSGRLEELIKFEAERARQWYATGLTLLPMLDRRSRACTGAMAGIYLRLLDHICAAPHEALDHRMSLPTGEKALVAARALAGMTRRPRPAPPAAAASAPGGQP
jgi:15-cis-phytoene synthase